MRKHKTIEEFVKEASIIHNNKYCYDKSVYVNSKTKPIVICYEHGEFAVSPNNHLRGRGCSKCKYQLLHNKLKSNTNEFINKSIGIHGSKYDYSKVEYVNSNTKISIICPIHGEFLQTPHKHLLGSGCKLCANERVSNLYLKTTQEFIEKAREIHHNKYDYSKVEYVDALSKVCIICPEHGEFWQLPSGHLSNHGCFKCKISHLEQEVKNILEQLHITYNYQSNLNKILGKQTVDFYLPDYNIVIECQGIQHFKPIKFFGGEKGFFDNQIRDNKKYNICIKNNIDILYINYDDNNIKQKIIEKIYK